MEPAGVNADGHRDHDEKRRALGFAELDNGKLMMKTRSLNNIPFLLLTQELISRRLGAHRSSISEAAAFLRRKGVIQYLRGMTILDSGALKTVACECYDIVKKEFGQVPIG